MKFQILRRRQFLGGIALILLMAAMLLSVGSECAFAATSLKVSPAKKIIYVGNKTTFKSNRKVSWSIVSGKSNIKILTKSSKKITVIGQKSGTSYLKAKVGKKYKKIKVVIKSIAPTSIVLNQKHNDRNTLNTTMNLAEQGSYERQLHVVVTPSSAKADVSYYSSNISILTVSATGLVKAVKDSVEENKEAYVTITAVSKYNTTISDSITYKIINDCTCG